eukprot:12399245-Karenia_brevis.AAC.1
MPTLKKTSANTAAQSSAAPEGAAPANIARKRKIGNLTVKGYVAKQFRENSQLKHVESLVRSGTLVKSYTMENRLIYEYETDRDLETGLPLTRGKKYYANLIDLYKAAAENKPTVTTTQEGAKSADGTSIRKSLLTAMFQYKSGSLDALEAWCAETMDPTTGEIGGMMKALGELKPGLTQKEHITT